MAEILKDNLVLSQRMLLGDKVFEHKLKLVHKAHRVQSVCASSTVATPTQLGSCNGRAGEQQGDSVDNRSGSP